MEKQRQREKERYSHVPTGGGRASDQTPPPPAPSAPGTAPSLTSYCSRPSPCLRGHTLCPGGSRGTFPGPHTCSHAGPEGKRMESLGAAVSEQPRLEASRGAQAQTRAGDPALIHTGPPGSAGDTPTPSALTHCCGQEPWDPVETPVTRVKSP